ncbi:MULTISPECIES: MucBP domain-containing protein [Levilactobacillus]|uniref:MucBP domain-containing protein n=1 Tax=Levilactobacillus TaxID=2767886 RepID=UPI0037569815
MTKEIHSQSKNRSRNTRLHKKSNYLLYTGLVLASLNIGLINGPSKKASADTTSTDVATTSGSSANESSTQTLRPSTSSSIGQDNQNNGSNTTRSVTEDTYNTDTSSPSETEDPTADNTASTDMEANETANSDNTSNSSSNTSDTSSTDTDSNDDTAQDKNAVKSDISATNADNTTGTADSDYSSGTSLSENPKTVTPSTGDKLDSKYVFIPKFKGSGTTEVQTIGTVVDKNKANTVAVDLPNAVKGQVGFIYTNVGYDADGNSIDLKIIYTDWGRLSDVDSAYLETYTNMLYTNIAGAGWVDVTYQFVRHDNGQAANVSGLMTLTDIDGGQTVSISDDQLANLDAFYLPTSLDPTTGAVDNWLHYTTENGYTTISSPSELSENDDEYAMFTFTYSNQSSLSFRYSNGKDAATPTKMTLWSVNYIPQKPLATETVAPVLKVIDNSGTATTTNTLSAGQSSYQYQITQLIPDEWSQYYYGNVDITASLPGSVLSYTVKDSAGNDVTSYFENKSNGSDLDLAATADALKSADFYGQRYTITTTIAAPADTVAFDQYTVHSTTTIDGDAKDSGNVTTTLYNQHQITVHYYKKGTTEQLAPDEVMTVTDGQTYTAPSKSFTGYTLSSQINTSGIYNGESDAIFYYAVQKGTVTVYYKTDTGGVLYKETITGNVGEKFTVDALDFDDGDAKDFILKGADQITGTYTSANQTVTFIYQVPRVHTSTSKGVTAFTVTYADGSVKSTEIFDNGFDIILTKNSKGQSIVAVQSISPKLADKVLYLSNIGMANFGNRFGYFNTKEYSYIFEKAYNSNHVKVMKIDNKSGSLTVKTINLSSKSYSSNAVAKTLGISQSTPFKSFWDKYISGNDQTKSSIQEKNGTNNLLSSKITYPGSNTQEQTTTLPQTSEAKSTFSIYGYVLLLLLSTVGLFKKWRKRS